MAIILKDETIVYFGPEPWEGLWRNRHQLMSRFAKHNDVWYVEPPAMLRQLFSRKKHRTRLSSCDASGVNIFHSPWWLPLIGRAPFKSLSIRLYLFILSRLAGFRKRKPIVWLSKPNMIDFLERVPAQLSIYHVVDEYSGYGSPSKAQRQKLLDKEAELLRSVDVAIVVTPSLHALKLAHNPNIHLVPNAADYSAYSSCEIAAPGDMKNIRKPIIGYTGLIAARLDLEMLIAAAEARTEWSFVFVGSVNDENCRTQLTRLRNLGNVYFLGQKSVVDTPSYVKRFDVCTIPYLTNLRAQHASPLKLYEYAAASKPIVSTDFAAAREFGGNIELVQNANEFIEACGRCLDIDPTSASIVENRCFAAENTWEKRVEQVSDIINSYL
jgi:glycosyltransferase involved in cell wall biosynthesis